MNRRRILTGLLAAPLIVRTPGLLMPVRKVEVPSFTVHLGVWRGVEWQIDESDEAWDEWDDDLGLDDGPGEYVRIVAQFAKPTVWGHIQPSLLGQLTVG